MASRSVLSAMVVIAVMAIGAFLSSEFGGRRAERRYSCSYDGDSPMAARSASTKASGRSPIRK
jgi:hypothetical protein